MKKIKVVLAQLDLQVGDISGNLKKHIEAVKIAEAQEADVIVFPELSLIGYPAEDLLLRRDFLRQANEALEMLKSEVNTIYCLVGHPYETSHGLYNACSLLHKGELVVHYTKQSLPNYGVFDECRYFIPGSLTCVVPIRGIPVGIVICEDLWRLMPIQQAVAAGAQLILVPNASPFEITKHEQRLAVLAKRAKDHHVPIVYVNCVGGQDDLVFDGGSMVVDATGEICQYAGCFTEVLKTIEIDVTQDKVTIPSSPFVVANEDERIYQALVLGVRDYVEKNHFSQVWIGLSGGIDSALTLAIAVDALGSDRVNAVIMPSRFSAQMSVDDAVTLANNVNVKYEIISIEKTFTSFLESLDPQFTGLLIDTTEENLQARCRGMILMALSNKKGGIVLVTGNRSEYAVGYATLYGDMAGGFAVLKDVLKTEIYKLAAYRNKIKTIIPERIITRPPSAELAPNQTDQDSLPPYEILDAILFHYLNEEKSIEEITALGFDSDTVKKISKLIAKNEYKRKQAAPGVRINHKAFGRDRRYPITSGYKG